MVAAGIALVRGRLVQRREEVGKYLLIGEIVVVQDVGGVVRDARENAVRHLPPALIDLHHCLVVKLQRLGVALEAAEHGAVGHIVAVDHGDGIVQLRIVVGSLGIQRTGLVVVAVQVAVQIPAVIHRMLGDEAALADGAARGVGDLHIGVGVGPRLLRRLEVHRHVGGLRLHQHDLLRRVGVRLILVLIFRTVVLTAAGQQRQCRQQGCARQNIPFLSHDGLLSAVRIPSADKGTHACHLMARNAGQRARCPAPLRWGYLTICRPQMQDPFDRSQ